MKKNCPIEKTIDYIGKKWTLILIRDMFFGKKRFHEFLESNPTLSTKVLSDKLKELETNGLIVKNIVSKTPVVIEYSLSSKGRSLNKLLYEIAMYGVVNLKDEISPASCSNDSITYLKKALKI